MLAAPDGEGADVGGARPAVAVGPGLAAARDRELVLPTLEMAILAGSRPAHVIGRRCQQRHVDRERLGIVGQDAALGDRSRRLGRRPRSSSSRPRDRRRRWPRRPSAVSRPSTRRPASPTRAWRGPATAAGAASATRSSDAAGQAGQAATEGHAWRASSHETARAADARSDRCHGPSGPRLAAPTAGVVVHAEIGPRSLSRRQTGRSAGCPRSASAAAAADLAARDRRARPRRPGGRARCRRRGRPRSRRSRRSG